MSFAPLGLGEGLCARVAALGYSTPTSIQMQAIPPALGRRDLVAIAQTGTGKTAAFALPLVQRLLSTPPKAAGLVRGLILTPTRELALQVHADVVAYAEGTPLRVLLLHGGVSYAPQFEKLAEGVDIIVATPGRLRDHIDRATVRLGGVETLVLDEADRMLDMGFSEDVTAIIRRTDRSRQTLLFSATFSDEIRELAQRFLTSPVSIHATPQKVTAQAVEHTIHPVDPERKLDLLFEIIHRHLGQKILIFTRTKARTDEVCKDLIARGLIAIATHGDRTQDHRTKAMARFKEGRILILVATDIAARGIDTSDLGLVINFELPNLAEDYVHRTGRTGRAGSSGVAVSLVTQGELYLLPPIEALIKFKIPVVPVAGFEPAKFEARKPRQVPRAAWKKKPMRWGQVSR